MLNYSISSKYGTKREYGLHEGDDFISTLGKKAPIINMYDGILHNTFFSERSSGNTINMMTNPKFFNGVDVGVFIDYCHLDRFSDVIIETSKKQGSINRLVKQGTEIGKMGNTGYCMTFENGRWRRITGEEQSDPNFTRGVHLHYQVRVQKESDAIKLKEDIINKGCRCEIYYFKQWNQYYFNPSIFEEYMITLGHIKRDRFTRNAV
jgi:murein DD-endopeptidase MepM/ murein hydrolase activator NlpD